jgi:hypothetical protein
MPLMALETYDGGLAGEYAKAEVIMLAHGQRRRSVVTKQGKGR